jgi:hypothetical protein
VLIGYLIKYIAGMGDSGNFKKVTFTGALGAVRPYNSAGPPKTVSMCKSKY